MLTCSWLILGAISIGQTTDRLPERFEFTQIQMGMTFRVVLYAPDEDSANAAASAAYARIKQLNALLSDYDPQSELMQLCRTAGLGKKVHVGPDLLAVLTQSQALSKKSDGAFDITVGPFVKLWRKARRTKQFPAPDELAAARRSRYRLSRSSFAGRRTGRYRRIAESGHAAGPGRNCRRLRG